MERDEHRGRRALSKPRAVAIWALRIVLGIAFTYVAATKLTGTGNTVQYFAAIGWGQWFRFLTGSVDLVGAVLLFVPRWTLYGAIALACSVGLGAVISLTVLHGDPKWGAPVMVVVPAILASLAAVLAWLTRPNQSA